MSYAADDFDFIAKRVKEFKKQREELLKDKPKEESNKDKLMEQQLDWFAKAIMSSPGAPYKPKAQCGSFTVEDPDEDAPDA